MIKITFRLAFFIAAFIGQIQLLSAQSAVIESPNLTLNSNQNSDKIILDSLPRPQNWVTDFDHVLSTNERNELESLLAQFESQTTIEICLVTLDTALVTNADLNDLSMRLFEKWQLGKDKKDNGILIMYAPNYDAVRVLKGSGIDALTDEENFQIIINSYFNKGLSSGKHFQYLLSGLKELTRVLSK